MAAINWANDCGIWSRGLVSEVKLIEYWFEDRGRVGGDSGLFEESDCAFREVDEDDGVLDKWNADVKDVFLICRS